MRLVPCRACGRHLRASERECPFCTNPRLIGAGSGPLTAALLGLCLAACTGGGDPRPAAGPDTQAGEQPPVETPAAPQPEPEQLEPSAPEPAETTSASEVEPDDTTSGEEAGVDEVEPEPKPKPAVKPSEPRPAKAYGGPPGLDGPTFPR
ncbi:MAG: hypothetical protein R6X02_05515 [Enhygromyxa sp.]